MSQTKAQLVGGVGISTVGDLSVYGGVNATGIVTATSFYGGSATITGNVSIAGTLTYEDVTNVDSVGLITARAGIKLTGGDVTLGTGVTISGATSNVFTLSTNGSERVRVSSAGSFAIGNTNPSALLDVSGNAKTSTLQIGTNPAGVSIGVLGIPNQKRIYGRNAANSGDVNILYIDGSNGMVFGPNDAAVIDSSGRLLVGTSSGRSNFFNSSYSPQFQVETADNLTRAMSVVSSTAGVEGGIIILGNQRSGSVGGNTAVIASDELGQIAFQGSDGTEFVAGATISAAVDGTPGANDMPGRLVFSTTADGASSPTERARISSSGGFSVGTTANPGAGAIYATGDITAFYSSDIRLKKDIEPISEPIKKLMEISGVTYKWNEEYLKDKDVDGYFVRETEVGVIAQEVEKVLPEVVATRENGYKAVRYEKLVALLIEAVKDQQHQIDELKARLEGK